LGAAASLTHVFAASERLTQVFAATARSFAETLDPIHYPCPPLDYFLPKKLLTGLSFAVAARLTQVFAMMAQSFAEVLDPIYSSYSPLDYFYRIEFSKKDHSLHQIERLPRRILSTPEPSHKKL
jgi:hypothetical protein